MRQAFGILAMLAVGMAPSGSLLGLQEEDPRAAKKRLDLEAREKIKEFKKTRKKAMEEADLVNALESLGEMLHPRILNELGRYLRGGTPLIRREAARQIARYKKDFMAARRLLKVVGREKDIETAEFFMECVGEIASRKTARALIKHYKFGKIKVARAAVEASAKLKSKSTIAPLISLIRQMELIQNEGDPRGGPAVPGLGGGYSGGGRTARDSEKWKRKKAILPAAIQALKDITGERWNKGREWEKWWQKNKNVPGLWRAKKNLKPARIDIWLDKSKDMKMSFVPIQAGSFRMGSHNGDGNEKPVREVRITKDFWMQTTEVTQAQWKAVMGTKPSDFKGEDRPVEKVSWEDCRKFVKELNARFAAQAGGRRFALPTEAEWEYACRAGSNAKWCFGDDESKLQEYAWYYKNSGSKMHAVGTRKANGWGLYDMHGNVWEWCEDWYGSYEGVGTVDPKGPSSGQYRVLRGGCWLLKSGLTRSAYRNWLQPSLRGWYVGARVALRKSP